MSKTKQSFIQKAELILFDPEREKVHLTPAQEEKLVYYKAVFSKWLQDPTLEDKAIVKYMMDSYGVSQAAAYRDLGNIKVLLGNVQNAGREWQKYTANAMIKEAYALAKNADDKTDIYRAEVLLKAAKTLIDGNRLNKMQANDMPYHQIVPPEFEPVYDTSLLEKELPKDLDDKIEKMKKKYDIQDAQVIEDE